MNNKLNSYIESLGALCETWTIVYKNFLALNMDAKEALVHTQGFMTAFISAASTDGGKK